MNSIDDNDTFKIRPAGRHLLTIGRDLIQDKYAAIVELVKNAYDADSKDVEIKFSKVKGEVKVVKNKGKSKEIVNPDKLRIEILDHGHGMSRDTVADKWLVPSTTDKLLRKKSPNGRIMQGRKGIGRYAASILGSDLLLETNSSNKTTTVFIEWSQFEAAIHLSDVDILVETTTNIGSPFTKLVITGDEEEIDYWDESAFHKLEFELRKLKPPIRDNLDVFNIYLTFKDFWEDDEFNIKKIIEPFPLLELYDYKINGIIESNGTGSFEFINKRSKNTIHEKINFNFGHKVSCGKLVLDIRVYDRESDAIGKLIKRGLKDTNGKDLGKNEARNLLNEYNGIGVYRNGFRIRPLGDADYDWLELNKDRIQNPSLKIGSNQVIGLVHIESEEKSGLEEKSARDGLKTNGSYLFLKEATKFIISELETRRFSYRRKIGLSKGAVKIEREFEKLFSFDSIKKEIQKKLEKSGLNQEISNDIFDILSKKEKQNNTSIEEIRKAVAIYQGQATLGKIINVILHEGRRPLNFFKNSIPVFLHNVKKLQEKQDQETIEKVINIAERTQENSSIITSLFSRIDPLAAGKRGPKKEFKIKKELSNSFLIFKNELSENGISVEIDCHKNVTFDGWSKDWYMIVTNLIDNSLFWLTEKKIKNPCITVSVSLDKNGAFNYLDFKDNGVGISSSLIESEVIFDPEFSTKPEGTGLGLAIAGEAASRNGLKLEAFESEIGAYLRLQVKDN